jgi:hypothetical protein
MPFKKNTRVKEAVMKVMVAALRVTLMLLFAATALYAAPGQGWRGSGGWGTQGAYGRLYDPATVETVTGKVLAVETFTPMKGMGAGIHLKLRTDRETVPVHLGPAWYIDRLEIPIRKGDLVEITGSRVTIGGKPAIIASEVRKGDEVLPLRDQRGVPAWSGWRRQQ